MLALIFTCTNAKTFHKENFIMKKIVLSIFICLSMILMIPFAKANKLVPLVRALSIFKEGKAVLSSSEARFIKEVGRNLGIEFQDNMTPEQQKEVLLGALEKEIELPKEPTEAKDMTSEFDSERAKLEEVDLTEADFNGQNLRDADFSGQNLKKANFRHADLTGANLSRADLGKADFTGAILYKVNFQRCKPYKGKLLRSRPYWGRLYKGRPYRGNLSRANFRHGQTLLGQTFTKQGQTFIRANFHKAILTRANFREADLTGAILLNADLSGAIRKANLTGADFSGADLTDFRGRRWADLSGRP